MFKIYLRQAIQMLKQNRFISIISILGTAVAIMMIMAIIVSEEIKTIDLAPESNRSRTLYINAAVLSDSVSGRTRYMSSLDYELIHTYILQLTKPLKKGIVSNNSKDKSAILNIEGKREIINGVLRLSNAEYWDILEFNFIEGKPYSEEEVFSGIKYAILSESTAKRLFNTSSASGKTIQINLEPHRIIGVVKDIQPIYEQAYADVWVPYTSNDEYKRMWYEAMLMADSESSFPEIIAEVRECERQYGKEKEPWELYFRGPQNRKILTMKLRGDSIKDLENKIKEQQRKKAFILCMLLLIPAINLSGISLSRIKKRTEEIGVRKAFGAKKYIILTQVLYENFITSLIGGIIGLILSYIVVFWMREWLLGIPANSPIPISSLISPIIFMTVFIACIIINLLSAGLPALKASRTNIINSLNQNEKS